MPRAAFVISKHAAYPLREFITAVADELEHQGIPTRTYDAFPPPAPDQVYVLVAPREYLLWEGPASLPEQMVLDRTVFLGAERPEELRGLDDVEAHMRAGAVFDISQRGVVRLHQLGVPARLLRPGHSEVLEHYDHDAERPIDVVFLGADTPRRRALLGAMANRLARHACVLQLASEPLPPGETDSFRAGSRWSTLSRAKILLNLHRNDECAPMPWLRMMDAFHSGAVLLSEPAAQTLPFVAGEHFLVARPEVMGSVLEAVLSDGSRLAAVRAAAHERLSRWLPLAASVAVLRAALVELLGQPLPDRAALGIGAGSASPRHSVTRDEVSVELEATRAELARLRHAVARLGRTHGASVEPARVRVTNGAWRALRAPQFSVLVTLGEDATDALLTLESIASSRRGEHELVVVARASSTAAHLARRWLCEHPRVASTLVTAPPALGCNGWRRLGAAICRAPFSVVLDGGVGLYPRGFEVLLGAIAPDSTVAFARPMLVVCDRGDAAGEDGTVLRLSAGEDRISSPLIARTEVLRAALDSLADDPFRADDPELLCPELEATGRVGRAIPEFVAWRRRQSTPLAG